MKIHIPTPLRAYTGQKETVEAAGATAADALESLVVTYPELRGNLFGSDGKLRSFVNVYLNDDDIRYLPEKEFSPVTDADELTIIPSIAGGVDAKMATEIDMTDAVPNPKEDLEHAHALLARMSPEQLLQATYAIEEIVEASPEFQEKLRKSIAQAEAGPWYTMEEVLADNGLTMQELKCPEPAKTREVAA
jgi:molybdopterin synthase sulfur carrier subunit